MKLNDYVTTLDQWKRTGTVIEIMGGRARVRWSTGPRTWMRFENLQVVPTPANLAKPIKGERISKEEPALAAHPILPGIPKKIGRPKTSPLSRAEQQREANRRYRDRMKTEGNDRYSVFLDRALAHHVETFAENHGMTFTDAINEVVKRYFAANYKESFSAPKLETEKA